MQTNPFLQGGTPGPVTTYQYDLLGRATLVTLPGGNTVQTSYSGSIVTVTDQVNRQIKRESDGLGRLVKVTEQDVASGALTQETTYTYDVADRLTLVNQGNQTRAFKYDSEGRLLYERIPEQTATINDGTGTLWTTKYTYTDWGVVATKQDARGVVTTYGYDTLHRLVSLSYNTSGAPGVATTPSVTYTYDTNNNSATKGLLLSVSVASVYSESYSYDAFKRVQSLTRTLASRNYTTSYQLDTANQLTQLTYASNRVLNISHDAKGRVSSMGSYLSSVTYNGIGQVTGLSSGNGVSESYGYDANRMQMVTQTATKSGGAQNGLMNLTYGYNATAGQMGAGSTAGNAGQLMSVSGTINSTTEAASYTYDNLGRLVTANQSSNLSLNAQRRFAYDRWGNRTGVWDATSGGTQIQSITLQQSGGVPTNRITSVTTTGTVNYSYDATGNVTNDGAHSYTYDAENRLVSVDAGAAQYSYDQRNRRVKKVIGSSTTHYVWEGGQALAEHNGSTGAVIADYIYSGSRMLAKVAGLNTQYFLSDRLSVRLTLDASGNVIGRQAHLPFGEDFAESGTQQKQHFTSYERDSESGTDYAVNRQYTQSVGRFNRVDPYSGSTRINNPQSLNRYAYVQNDPANQADQLGLSTDCEYDPNTNCFYCVLFDSRGVPFISKTCLGDLPQAGGFYMVMPVMSEGKSIEGGVGEGCQARGDALRKKLGKLRRMTADLLAGSRAEALYNEVNDAVTHYRSEPLDAFQHPAAIDELFRGYGESAGRLYASATPVAREKALASAMEANELLITIRKQRDAYVRECGGDNVLSDAAVMSSVVNLHSMMFTPFFQGFIDWLTTTPV